MSKQIQIVRMSTSILDYFISETHLDNESKHVRDIKIQEFKDKITESLNCGVATKEVIFEQY